MAAGDKLPFVVLLLVVVGGGYYLGWVRPAQRRSAATQLISEAIAAYEANDCATAAARFADAHKRLGNDTLTSGQREIESRCETFLGTPAGGIARFLDRAIDHVCAGRAPAAEDDLGRRYGPEFFGLVDSTAGRFWASPDLQPFVPEALRAAHVSGFRFALCAQIVESRQLERCAYTVYRGGAPQNVYLTRAEQTWQVRAIDVPTRRTVRRARFRVADPGPCEENEHLLNRPDPVITGGVDTARFAAWLREVVRR